MKVLLITQRDPFFVDTFLKEFDTFGLPYTIIDLPNFNSGKLEGVKKAYRVYGFSGIIKLICLRMWKFKSVKFNNCLSEHRLSNLGQNNIGIDYKAFDVVCSVSAPARIDTSIFSSHASLVNIHCGSLPDHAGMMPIFWQIYHGKESITLTLHELAPEIDEGTVLLTEQMQIEQSLFMTSVRAKKKSAELLVEFLKSNGKQISSSKISSDGGQVTLSKFPSREHVNTLRKVIRLI